MLENIKGQTASIRQKDKAMEVSGVNLWKSLKLLQSTDVFK